MRSHSCIVSASSEPAIGERWLTSKKMSEISSPVKSGRSINKSYVSQQKFMIVMNTFSWSSSLIPGLTKNLGLRVRMSAGSPRIWPRSWGISAQITCAEPTFKTKQSRVSTPTAGQQILGHTQEAMPGKRPNKTWTNTKKLPSVNLSKNWMSSTLWICSSDPWSLMNNYILIFNKIKV